jgi:general secretion pathway protein A
VRAFLATLDTNRHLIIPIAAPIASSAALYRTLLLALNERPPFGAAAQLAALRGILNDSISNRRFPVIVLDEAHLLDPAIIDPLRILLASQLDSHSLATLILIGQSDLKRTLQLNALQAFTQRITVRASLDPLGLEAALGYITHHLKIAGGDATTVLAQDALQRIADFAQGNPRRINQIVTAALLAAAADKKRIVDDTAVRRAINDLDHD